MLRKFLIGILGLVVVAASYLFVTAPAELINEADVSIPGSNLTLWLQNSEQEVSRTNPIIPNTEKRIRWFQNRHNRKTPYSIVYLHGYSATRQEIAPVGEMIADRLRANLFETRLAGHGYIQHSLAEASAEDWIKDGAEALAVGAAIGERIILMGTSTGATLVLAMVDRPAFKTVKYLVLLSPNYAPKDKNAEFMTWPGGPQLSKIILGEVRTWEPNNELQAKYWTTSYPTESLIEMMRLVKYAHSKLPLNLSQPVLTIYSPADRVVNTDRIVQAYEEMQSPGKQIISIPSTGKGSSHVLAGDIMAPENNQLLTDSIVGFVKENE